jgi:arabinose-5-phosphate isomerase
LKSKEQTLETARNTIILEANSLLTVAEKIDNQLFQIVEQIIQSKGRVIVTGIGKSAIIGQKIVATLNSTGTPSIFMHAADAIHGDLGIIQEHDIIICISKSGNTPEIKLLVPLLKRGNNCLIAICGNRESYLGIQSDYYLDTYVEKEACPNNLAPTTSTIAQLAIGDALAVCLLESRNFTSEDFAKFHPGGALGKQLFLKVSDVIQTNEIPTVKAKSNIKDVLNEITSKRLGATAVEENNTVIGIITDGDIRRMLEKYDNISGIIASDIMNKAPKMIDANELAADALVVLKKYHINQLIVMNENTFAGILHIQDLLREGIV